MGAVDPILPEGVRHAKGFATRRGSPRGGGSPREGVRHAKGFATRRGSPRGGVRHAEGRSSSNWGLYPILAQLWHNTSMTATHTTFQLHCHVRKGGHVRIAEVCGMLNRLYNAALQERRDAYRMAGVSVSLYDQNTGLTAIRGDDPDWKALDVNVSRGVLRRLDRAMASFFRRVKEAGEAPGFPRFKPVSRFRCIELAQPRPGMVKVQVAGRKAHIRIKGLPVLELRLKRPLPPSEALKSLRLVKRPNGWYADLAYAVDKEPLPPCEDPVGLDMGVNNRIALSTGEMVGRREIDRTLETRLRQSVARKRKGSHRRRKAVAMLSKETRRNTVRNRNECHRVTTDIVQRFGRIAVEKLTIPNMTQSAAGTVEEPGVNVAAKSGLNREILTQTWGLIRNQLAYKAEWAGREFVEVNPKYTSRECSACGNRTPQSEYRTYACGVCGMIADRDTNAALNVLERAFELTGAGFPPASSGARTIPALACG